MDHETTPDHPKVKEQKIGDSSNTISSSLHLDLENSEGNEGKCWMKVAITNAFHLLLLNVLKNIT